jgi:hypothetical protein
MFKIFGLKKQDTGTMSVVRKLRDFNFIKRVPLPLIVLISTFVLTLLLFPYTVSVQLFNLPKVGEVSSETIIAPFTFDIIRMPDELERERKKLKVRSCL